eukprot:5018322-Pleurochrysis_carterae.AAC.1
MSLVPVFCPIRDGTGPLVPSLSAAMLPASNALLLCVSPPVTSPSAVMLPASNALLLLVSPLTPSPSAAMLPASNVLLLYLSSLVQLVSSCPMLLVSESQTSASLKERWLAAPSSNAGVGPALDAHGRHVAD